MPRGSENASEFKRYQQALAAIYIGTISAGALLLAASVVAELFFRPVGQLPGPVLSPDISDPSDLLKCEADVERLYDDLNRTAVALLALPSHGQDSELLPKWEIFSQGWLTRWAEVNGWCRFSELADTRRGEAYDLMANAHSNLLAIRLKYQSLLAQFDKDQAAELVDVRRALERSRRLISGGQPAQGANSEGAP